MKILQSIVMGCLLLTVAQAQVLFGSRRDQLVRFEERTAEQKAKFVAYVDAEKARIAAVVSRPFALTPKSFSLKRKYNKALAAIKQEISSAQAKLDQENEALGDWCEDYKNNTGEYWNGQKNYPFLSYDVLNHEAMEKILAFAKTLKETLKAAKKEGKANPSFETAAFA